MARQEFLRRAGAVVAGAVLWSPVPTALAGRRFSPADRIDSIVPTAWFDQALDLVRTTPGFSPPVASRAFAYAGIALYEAVVPGMPGYRSLARLPGAPKAFPAQGKNAAYDWATVANASLASLLRSLFDTAPAASVAALTDLERARSKRRGVPRSRKACSSARSDVAAKSPPRSSNGRRPTEAIVVI